MEEAADLIDSALHMSGMEQRFGDGAELLRKMASDESDGGSLVNIIRDIRYMDEEQPLWTQPLTSPKNQF